MRSISKLNRKTPKGTHSLESLAINHFMSSNKKQQYLSLRYIVGILVTKVTKNRILTGIGLIEIFGLNK